MVTAGSRVLVVGPLNTLDAALSVCAAEAVVSVTFARLSLSTVAQVRPDLVLAPLLGPGFDIIDIANRLEAMGFRDRLRAVSAPLPDADAVVREVRHQFRDLDFALIELTAAPVSD